jgi:Uma2 family endonuclease
VEVEVPTRTHEDTVAWLCYALTAWSEAGHGGRATASGYKVRVSERRGVMPDVQFYRRENESARAQQGGLTVGRPDLVVEVVSPSSRRYDRVTKLRWYAQLGVPEYWLVDPEARTLERLVLGAGGYTISESLEDAETFAPGPPFEGLELPLAKLWEAGA